MACLTIKGETIFTTYEPMPVMLCLREELVQAVKEGRAEFDVEG